MTTEPTPPWPEEIRLKPGGRELEIAFDDGSRYRLPAEYLRVESPSAEVKGHGPGQEITVIGKENVAVTRLEPVGNYALRIIFDDGHSTGLYTWTYLHHLASQRDSIWQSYLARVAQKRS